MAKKSTSKNTTNQSNKDYCENKKQNVDSSKSECPKKHVKLKRKEIVKLTACVQPQQNLQPKLPSNSEPTSVSAATTKTLTFAECKQENNAGNPYLYCGQPLLDLSPIPTNYVSSHVLHQPFTCSVINWDSMLRLAPTPSSCYSHQLNWPLSFAIPATPFLAPAQIYSPLVPVMPTYNFADVTLPGAFEPGFRYSWSKFLIGCDVYTSPSVSISSLSSSEESTSSEGCFWKKSVDTDETSTIRTTSETIEKIITPKIDPFEFYLTLPEDLFPKIRMLSLDPNPIIDIFCKVSDIHKIEPWLLDLEYGLPRVPVTRPIAIYDVQYNRIHCKNTPGAVHPGFENCSKDFKSVVMFYYDCIISTWYRGYTIMYVDVSVANYQSWLRLPMQVFGMCWP